MRRSTVEAIEFQAASHPESLTRARQTWLERCPFPVVRDFDVVAFRSEILLDQLAKSNGVVYHEHSFHSGFFCMSDFKVQV